MSSRCLHYFSLPCWWSTELHQHGGSILGSVNLRKTFRWISEVWENAETQNLEKCLLYPSPIIIKFLDFILWIVFNLVFHCVIVKTTYSDHVMIHLGGYNCTICHAQLIAWDFVETGQFKPPKWIITWSELGGNKDVRVSMLAESVYHKGRGCAPEILTWYQLPSHPYLSSCL